MEWMGRAAVVTGAARGIGLALSTELIARGTKVALVDVDASGLEAAIAALNGGPAEARAYVCDLGDDAAVAALGEKVMADLGTPDLVFNNAYVPVLGGIDDIVLDDWRKALDVNVLGYVRIVKAFAPAMIVRGSGHIMNTASPMGIVPNAAAAGNMLPYCASKAADIGLTSALAAALVPRGVNVSIFYPDVTSTWRDQTLGAVDAEFTSALRSLINDGATPASAALAMLQGIDDGRYLVSAEVGFEQRLVQAARSGFDPFARAAGNQLNA